MQCSGLRPSRTCNVFVLHDRANQLTNTFCVEQAIFFHLPTLEPRSTKADLLTLYNMIHNHISVPLFRIIFSSRHTHRIIIRPVRLPLYDYHRSFTDHSPNGIIMLRAMTSPIEASRNSYHQSLSQPMLPPKLAPCDSVVCESSSIIQYRYRYLLIIV